MQEQVTSGNQGSIADELILWSREVVSGLERDGFAFCKKLSPQLTTLEIARRVGSIVEIDKMLPSSGIPTVQILLPRTAREARENRYSGNYGLGAFPLHTDLAHWAIPPRYFLLRCLLGSENVETSLLPTNCIVDKLGKVFLQKAVLRVRKHRRGSSGLLRALSYCGPQELFRWDTIFLEPVNDHAAKKLKHVMEDSVFDRIIGVCLRDRGDTLFLDNWRFLHGRSAVPFGSARQIERVYFSR